MLLVNLNFLFMILDSTLKSMEMIFASILELLTTVERLMLGIFTTLLRIHQLIHSFDT
jgi:hypothetical protein